MENICYKNRANQTKALFLIDIKNRKRKVYKKPIPIVVSLTGADLNHRWIIDYKIQIHINKFDIDQEFTYWPISKLSNE